MDPSSERSRGWNFASCKEVLLVSWWNIIMLGDLSFSWGEGLSCWEDDVGSNQWVVILSSNLYINKSIQVFLHTFVCLLIYACVWSIYIWSYIVYDCRSLHFEGIMLLWIYRYSLKRSNQGRSGKRSVRGEKEQARNQAKDWGWYSLLLSYLFLVKENESNFNLFVSKIATRLSGTSSSEWTIDFPITANT